MTMLGTALLALMIQAQSLQSIQGVVIRKGTSEALSNATVELRRDEGTSGIVDSMTTEDDGRFSFSTVPPGRYRLTVARRDYARPPFVMTLASGQRAVDIPLYMSPTGSVSGRVSSCRPPWDGSPPPSS